MEFQKTLRVLGQNFETGAALKGLLLAGLLTLAPAAWATDYYVRTDGNDANAGTANTSGGAWATVKKCAQTVVAGDRCLIQSGTYNAEGASWSQTNAGTLESNNLLANCTCTNGTNTINCVSAIPGTVGAGDFVQCDSGNGFSWSRVQSVASSTITLGEPYRGVTSTTAGADTLDVANFIEIIGDGASEAIVVSKWQAQPGSVTWTKEAGLTCVYSYDPSAVTGSTEQSNAWKAKWCVQGSAGWATACSVDGDCGTGTPKCRLIPKGFRDTNGGWDTVTLGAPNGLDPYHRLGETGLDLDYDGVADTSEDQCPCGDTADGQTKLVNIDAVPGSYTYDTTGATPKVYVSTRRTCSGGTQSGYTCYGDADCPGSTCGSCASPTNMYAATHASLYNDGSPTPPFQFLKAYTVVRNLVLDSGAYHGPGNGFADHRTVNFGASNALYDNIEVRSGTAGFQMAPGGTPLADTTFENLRFLSGSRCTSTTSALTGVTFNRQEMRGTSGTMWNCQTMVGASATDPVKITRGYFHREFSNLGSASCGSQSDRQSWDCSTKYFASSAWKWTNGHGIQFGSQASDNPVCNTKWENNVFELIGGPSNNDALELAGSKSPADYVGCATNTVAYNTFINQQASNRAIGIQIGSAPSGTNNDLTPRDSTFVAGLRAYGNNFLTDWSSAQSSSCIFRKSGTPTSVITSDYNAFIYPNWDANGGGSTQNNSSRIWNSGETLASIVNTTGQESHSVMTCADGCSAASPGTHFNSTSTQVSDGYSYDFTASNPTPLAGGRLVGAGAPNGTYPCPTVDFYGNLRNDGACDIGAVELQGQAAIPAITTTTGNWTDGASVTIIGTNFGTKTTAAPLVWDDATGANILTKWRQVLPNNISEAPTENTNYRTAPFNGINGPHSRAPKFIGGLHKRDGFYTGNNVVLEKQFTPGSGWLYVYFWTMRDPTFKFCADPGVSGCGGTPDDNWKDGWYDQTAETYSGNGWNVEANPRATSCASAGNWQWHIYDSTGACTSECNTVTGDHSTYGSSRGTPCDWRLIEWRYKLVQSATTDAFQIFENGSRRMNVTGYTDGGFTGANRYISIGGYSRAMSSTNWRYFSDVYVDTTPARVLLCRNATISETDHGICYPQIPTAWSDTNITVTVNQAEFQGGTTAYLYVYNGSDLVSTTGTPIVLTATDTNTNTKIKGNVRIVGTGTKVK